MKKNKYELLIKVNFIMSPLTEISELLVFVLYTYIIKFENVNFKVIYNNKTLEVAS